MTTFILIFSIMTWQGSSRMAAIDHIEFDSKPACETAAAVINQHQGEAWRDYTILVCVPKR